MPTTPVYDHLLTEVTDALQRQVIDALLARPAGISRPEFVMLLFGYWPDDLENNQDDRKIRKAIENLREHWPILSSSGGRGYHLSEDPDEVKAYAAEQASRMNAAQKNVYRAHLWPSRIRAIQEYRKTQVKVEQPGLL
jgi:hypothetical protein